MYAPHMTVPDWLFVKGVERRLGRKLTAMEIEMGTESSFGSSELVLNFPNGRLEWINIPTFRFPDDLISHHLMG